jgi:deoxyribonucleoside regulator
MQTDRLGLLDRIAGLYYEAGLTQTEIAAKTGYSPSMISRLLSEAREQGIVEIRVNHLIERRGDLQEELQNLLGLRTAFVVKCGHLEYPQMLRQLGTMAARVVEEHAHDNMRIGISWGTAVYETVAALRMRPDMGAEVVLMIGSLEAPHPDISGPELARQLARILMGRYSILPAPLIVDSETTRQSLLNDSRVRRVMGLFRTLELALVGVGGLNPPESSALQRAGYLTAAQAQQLADGGAVGDVCAIFLDIEGRLINMPITRCIVGIDAANLAAIPVKIGVAGGPSKVLPIIGATRAGLINVLVTDDATARSIVNVLQGETNKNGESTSIEQHTN